MMKAVSLSRVKIFFINSDDDKIRILFHIRRKRR
jgi:hypothetical protein